jgi:hypothetical protein
MEQPRIRVGISADRFRPQVRRLNLYEAFRVRLDLVGICVEYLAAICNVARHIDSFLEEGRGHPIGLQDSEPYACLGILHPELIELRAAE